MKRNSNQLLLESPGAVTPVPWIDSAPDFTGFTDPTLSILQKAWSDFLASGQELEIIPDPEPTPEPVLPDWIGFNTAFLSNSDWLAIAPELPQDLRYGIAATAANGNAEGLQSAYAIASAFLDGQGTPIGDSVKETWQAIADAHNIPVTF